MKTLLVCCFLLTGCMTPEQNVRFRRTVESIDLHGGFSKDDGAHVGGSVHFRDPDTKGFAK